MLMNKTIRKLYYALINPGRLAVLDYPIDPQPLYSPETQPHQQLFKMISNGNVQYQTLTAKSLQQKEVFEKITVNTQDSKMPSWQNNFLPPVDRSEERRVGQEC